LADRDSDEKALRPLYTRQVLHSFSAGIVGPYLPIYAVQMGAASAEVGWLRSLTNLFGNIMQIPWGLASDRLGRRVPLIVLGGLLNALLFLPMIYVQTPWQLIALVAAQAFVSSMIAPVWSALIGDTVNRNQRGTMTARINMAASLGSMAATLLSGYIMGVVTANLTQAYLIPLILAALVGFIASGSVLTFRERRKEKRETGISTWFDWKAFRRNHDFRTFSLISIVHSFFMSISWPLFSITTARLAQGDMVQIAYLSIVSGSVTLVARRFVGRLSDRAGRKPLIVLGRAGVFLFPLLYAVATNFLYLYAAGLVGGVLAAASEIAIFAYLLDVTPDEKRGASFALFNTLNGVSTFFGSLLGGYLTAALFATGLSELASLQIAYGISAAGRLAGGLLFVKIREPYKYASTVKTELALILTEDVDRAREQVRKAEDRGAAVDEALREDLEWLDTLIVRKRDEE
jgi:MFS family permease